MDEFLPKTMLEALQIFGSMIGILAMVIVVNCWLILPTIVMGVLYCIVRIYYLKTAMDIKRLECISKLNLFFTSTLYNRSISYPKPGIIQ